jgi:hypothetical protein
LGHLHTIYKAINEKEIRIVAGLANTNLSDFEFIRPVELIGVINRMRMIQLSVTEKEMISK